MRQLANFSLGVGLDILRGQIGTKEAAGVLGSVRETRRTVQVGQQIGEHKEVLDHPADAAPADGAALAREEAELVERLRAVRERRGG